MQVLKAFQKTINSIALLHKLYFGFGAILLIFSFVTFTYVKNSATVKEEINSVDLANEAMRVAEGLEKAAVNTETGVRGYQITEDTAFLEPYYRGRIEYAKKLKELRGLLISEDQQARLTKIDSTYKRWNNEFVSRSIKLQTAALASPENRPAYQYFFENNIKKARGKQ